MTVFRPTPMDTIGVHTFKKMVDIWVARETLTEFVNSVNDFGNRTGLGICKTCEPRGAR